MGLLASPFYKSSLNDCNFITVSNRDKIKQFKKEDGLYGDNQCIMAAQDIQKVLLSEHRQNESPLPRFTMSVSIPLLS